MRFKPFNLRLTLIISAVSAIVFVAAGRVEAETWRQIDVGAAYVNAIFFPSGDDQKVIVGADPVYTDLEIEPIGFPAIFGSGYFVSNDGGETFGDNHLDGYTIYDIFELPWSSDVWLAAARKRTRGGVLVSQDAGDTWSDELFCEGSEQYWRFAASNESSPRVYASLVNTGDGIRYSDDLFETCEVIAEPDVQARDIQFSSLDPNLAFASGDGFYAGGVLRSLDGGVTWTKFSEGLENLRVLSIEPSPHDPSMVYCGADTLTLFGEMSGKGIYQSLDTGKTWRFVGAAGARVLDIEAHPLNPKYLVAAGDSAGVFFSGSWGGGWENYSDGLPDAGVSEVGIPSWEMTEDGLIAFVSVTGHGLYKSERVITSVNAKGADPRTRIVVENVYPNPVETDAAVPWINPKDQVVKISLIDAFGGEVATLENRLFSAGDNLTILHVPSNLSSGVFAVAFESAEFTTIKTIVVER